MVCLRKRRWCNVRILGIHDWKRVHNYPYASNLVPNSTTRSTIAEGLNRNGNEYGVLLQSQSIESSILQAQSLQSNTSTCLEHHSKSIRLAITNMTEKVYFISCNYCGNPFGLPEKQFLVSCIITNTHGSQMKEL